MDRPNATDEKYLKGYDVMSYQKDLELYCDLLEDCLKIGNVGMNQERDYYRKKIEKLENMLNDSFQGHLLKVIIPRLENRIKDLEKENIEKNDELIFKNERIMELHKGLEKVCEHTDGLYFDFVPPSNCPFIWSINEDEFDRLEKWKEWCMSDE